MPVIGGATASIVTVKAGPVLARTDERQVETSSQTDSHERPRNQSAFSAAIQKMIDACDVQLQELRNMPLDGVAKMVNPTEQQRDALEQIGNATL